jgi:uncharacterized protein
MKIQVSAKPNKKRDYVEQTDATHYVVSVKEPAQQGKANIAIIKALADYFDISKSQILLTSGQTSKLKIFEVPDRLIDYEPRLKQKKLF